MSGYVQRLKQYVYHYEYSALHSHRRQNWGGKREDLSLPCSRLKAVELRDWTRNVFGKLGIYHDIQIRETRR